MENNFSKLLLEQAKKKPEKEILNILLDGKYSHLNYRKLLEGAYRYAASLKKAQVGSGEVVILILPHGIDLIFAYFGAILNGNIPSIMPYLTEKLIPEKYRKDLQSLLDITKPTGIITFEKFTGELSS